MIFIGLDLMSNYQFLMDSEIAIIISPELDYLGFMPGYGEKGTI